MQSDDSNAVDNNQLSQRNPQTYQFRNQLVNPFTYVNDEIDSQFNMNNCGATSSPYRMHDL